MRFGYREIHNNLRSPNCLRPPSLINKIREIKSDEGRFNCNLESMRPHVLGIDDAPFHKDLAKNYYDDENFFELHSDEQYIFDILNF